MPRTRQLSDEVILDRALSAFWRHGYAATSLRDLTRATGLSSAALYHRFGDKDGLFVDVLRRYADERLGGRLARLSSCNAPLDAIRAFLDEVISVSLADPEHRGCLLVNTVLDGAAISEGARELVGARLGEVEAFFGAHVRRAIADGALDGATDVAATAAALLGAVFAIRVLARLRPDEMRLRAVAEHAMRGLRGTVH